MNDEDDGGVIYAAQQSSDWAEKAFFRAINKYDKKAGAILILNLTELISAAADKWLGDNKEKPTSEAGEGG